MLCNLYIFLDEALGIKIHEEDKVAIQLIPQTTGNATA